MTAGGFDRTFMDFSLYSENIQSKVNLLVNIFQIFSHQLKEQIGRFYCCCLVISHPKFRLFLELYLLFEMFKFKKMLSLCTAISLVSYGCQCANENNKPRSVDLVDQTSLHFKSRKDHIADIIKRPQYDIIIIGGGCNGAGVLLDASTRGLRTLLIQKDDFGSGASSKSTKLIHGGVRYLEQVFVSWDSYKSRKEKFHLVKQAIIERSFMIDSAPHLTTKIPFLIPCQNMFSALYYYIGSVVYYSIYHYFAPKTPTSFNLPYFFNREEMTSVFPNLNPKFDTGVVYEDGSFNDARLLLTAILTATLGNGIKMPASFVPSNVLNRAEFLHFLKNDEGKITGVNFRDNLTQKVYSVKAKYVVNCTGVWSDKIRLIDNASANKRICMVGGSHITYDNKVASQTFGLCSPSADGRIILVVPWLNRVIAGTTEKTLVDPQNNPVCSEKERTFINSAMMEFMSGMTIEDFLNCEKARWCGIRPLVAKDATSDTKKLARTHVIERSDSGLYSLMGGKWTIYRKMGEDLVDQICSQERQKGNQLPESQTKGLPLLGYAKQSLKNELIKEKYDIGGQLYNTFGSLAKQISKGNLQRLYGSTTRAEIEFIVKNELVTEIEDVLMRRTRLCFLLSKQQCLSLVSVIGQILGKELGWSQKLRKVKIQQSIDRLVFYQFD